jgi:hypothetical protein
MGLTLNSGFTIGPGVVLNAGYTPPSTYITEGLQLYLDAGNIASYPGSGTTWTDIVGNVPFTLYNGVSHHSDSGGYFTFDASTDQYAQGPSIAQLGHWSVEVWHYYTGANTGGSPCIITEAFTGAGINYTLGAINNTGTDLETGWFNGGQWIYTGSSYTLTPGLWYHIVGTYDGTYPKLYINGSLVATGTTLGGSAYESGQGIRLMKRWDNPDFWGGNLSVVRIYDADIGQAGVTYNFTAERGRYGI